MMKWFLVVMAGLALSISFFLTWGTWGRSKASGCESLIREAREQGEAVKDLVLRNQIRKLIDEASFEAMAGNGRSCVTTITKVFKLLPSKL